MLDLKEKFKVIALQGGTTITEDLNSTGVNIEAYDEALTILLQTGTVTGAGTVVCNVQSSTALAGTYVTRLTSGTVSSSSSDKVSVLSGLIPQTDKFVRVNFDATGTVSAVMSATLLARVETATAGINSTDFA